MPVRVGIVGLANAGKTSLFNALTRAGVDVTAYATVGDRPNIGMAAIADERLDRLAEAIGSRNVTSAAVRVVDVPGTGRQPLGALRDVDALVAVVNGWAPQADPQRELETIGLELLVADREHVERRLERVAKQAKSGEPALRDEAARLGELLAHLDEGRTLADYPHPLPPALEPLTTKPLVAVENGPGGVDLKLEAELTELPEEEASAFREGPSARDVLVPRLFEALELISFFTANENEARAWTLARGRTALEAAGEIHSDMARGFIRCEVVRWDELVAAGSRAEAARRGRVRLEGKGYVVGDGDVLEIRFNV